MSGVRGVLRGQLQVGAIQTIMDVAGLPARFRRAHPGVAIRLTHGAASDLARAAADAELGVGFIDGPVDPAKLTRRVACEVENIQYLIESVQHGLGITVLPPLALQAAGGQGQAVLITPPLYRDLSAVVAAGRPPREPRRRYSTCSWPACPLTPADALTAMGWARVW